MNPENELRLFFNELLSVFQIDIDDPILQSEDRVTELRERLSQASFSNYLNYIASLAVIVKQMGSLLVGNGYLERVTLVFT